MYSPGEDFYQYVNHAWLNNPANQIPPEYSSWGGFTKLYDDGLKNQIEIVKNLEDNCQTEEEYKIFAIWTASQQRFQSWKENSCSFNPLIQEFDLLEEYFKNCIDSSSNQISEQSQYIDCLAKYLHYTQISGINNLLDFDSGSDLQNVNNIVLDFSMGGLSLPSPEYYQSPKFLDKLSLFEQHLDNISKILQLQNLNLSPNFVSEVVNFEKKIAYFTMTPEQSREYDQYYTNTTLEKLYQDINKLNSLDKKEENYPENDRHFQLSDNRVVQVSQLLEKIYTHFNFRKILEDNFNHNFSQENNPPDKYHITAFDGDSIRRGMSLILDTNNFKEYKSYMHYQLIKSFHGFCSQDLDEEFFDFYSRKLGGQKQPKPEDKRSINIVNSYAGEMMGKLFVRKYFPNESKQEMEQLVSNVLTVMDESLHNNDWLTSDTKQKAVQKLSRFTSKIGHPERWRDYSDFNVNLGDSLYEISKKATKWKLRVDFFEKINSVLDRKEWRMTPQTVNAYFMPTQNEIVFPAAILQPPFCHQSHETIEFDIQEELQMVPDLDVITPCNYGGIGAVIAHEITHGYDDKGRKFDADGNLNDWWKPQDTELFKRKTDLMIKSVSKYIFIDNESGQEYKMNPQLTMGENLADIGGLSLSLKALTKKLDEDNTTEIVKKASKRVFLKAWASIWRQNINKDRRIMLLTTDPHGPTDFRGNLVQHLDIFYDIFDITKEDQMFLEPENRMTMW